MIFYPGILRERKRDHTTGPNDPETMTQTREKRPNQPGTGDREKMIYDFCVNFTQTIKPGRSKKLLRKFHAKKTGKRSPGLVNLSRSKPASIMI